jgi:hypothetical protein
MHVFSLIVSKFKFYTSVYERVHTGHCTDSLGWIVSSMQVYNVVVESECAGGFR